MSSVSVRNRHNVQVTHDTNPSFDRSESALAVSPTQQGNFVGSSKRFSNPATYSFSLAAYFTLDGGANWQESVKPLGLANGWAGTSDPAVAFDGAGNAYVVGLPFVPGESGDPDAVGEIVGIAVYRSEDGGQTWSDPELIHTSAGDDKQAAASDMNRASPYFGNVYTAWDNDGAGSGGTTQISFARTIDNGNSWIGARGEAPGSVLAEDTDVPLAPAIAVSPFGQVYIVWIANSQLKFVASRDGGETFTQPRLAANITPIPRPTGFGKFPPGTFRVLTLPAVCCDRNGEMVIAWADYREGHARIYWNRSIERGAGWIHPIEGVRMLSGPVATRESWHEFFPQLALNADGIVGCAFYTFGPREAGRREPAYLIDVDMAFAVSGARTFDTRTTVTDRPWDPASDAPYAHGDPRTTFIGDYFGLAAEDDCFFPFWTDTRTGMQEIFTSAVCAEPAVECSSRAIIQSSFRDGDHGNFEVVVRIGQELWHYWHDNVNVNVPWGRAQRIADGVAGPASIIQSDFGSRAGNFEVVVPLATASGSQDLWHFWHDNSDVTKPWARGQKIADGVTGPAAIIQSSFRSGDHGNFEVVVPIGDQLWHYWHDNSNVTLPWGRAQKIADGVTGPGAIVQSDFGSDAGNFEVVVPLASPAGGQDLWHYWHDNSDVTKPWARGQKIADGVTGPGSIIQSNFGNGDHGNFEVVVPIGDQLWHYWHDNSNVTIPWARGQKITDGVTGPGSIIQSDFGGNHGNFEVVVPIGDQLVHFWHDNDNVNIPWARGQVIATV